MTDHITCLATEGYYVDHLASIWQALDPQRRAPFYANERSRRNKSLHGVDTLPVEQLGEIDAAVLTCSLGDWKRVTAAGLPNPILPHGPGGLGWPRSIECWREVADKVSLMLVPAEYGVLDFLPCRVIGGQPKLDRWYRYKPQNKKPILAVSFRWHDATSAVKHYKRHLGAIKRAADKAGIQLLGHGHPLKEAEWRKMWGKVGVPFTPDFEEVLEVADVYAADCSSTSFEFVALDRPIVFLWAPWFEKFSYPPRFTHWWAGIENRNPLTLIADAMRALSDPIDVSASRKVAAAEMYGDFTGEASVNAARVLEEVYG